MTPEPHIDPLLAAAASSPVPPPSHSLIARVLADAASAAPQTAPPMPRKPRRGWLGPIGGLRGMLALATCAAMGVVAGAGYADTVLAIPGLDTVLAPFTTNTDSITPFDTLTLLMSES